MEISTEHRAESAATVHPFTELLESPRHRVTPAGGNDDDGVEIIVRVRFIDTDEED